MNDRCRHYNYSTDPRYCELQAFYNWVKRLRQKACYEIPPATGRKDYKPVPKQDVVKLGGIPEVPETVFPDSERQYPATSKIRFPIEIHAGAVSVKISNDINPKLLLQVIRPVTGIQRQMTSLSQMKSM